MQLRRVATNIFITVLLSLAILWGNVMWRQSRQFAKGEKGEAEHDFGMAISGYEGAIHMYAPFSPLVPKAAQRMWLLAGSLAQQGDHRRALVVYRSLRSSFYSAQWLASPGEEWIRRCDERIAAVLRLQGQGEQ